MESVCQRGGPERLPASADEPACRSHWAEGLRFAGAAAAAAGLVFGGLRALQPDPAHFPEVRPEALRQVFEPRFDGKIRIVDDAGEEMNLNRFALSGHARLIATNREAMTMSSHAHRTEWQLDTPPGKPLVYVLVIGRDARLGKSDGSEMLRFLVSASDVTATNSHTVSIVCQHAQVIVGEPGQLGP